MDIYNHTNQLSLNLSSDEYGSVSVLSNIFIDHYMPEANGTFVKIYLYLLRCLQANRHITIPEIADRLSCTDNDVKRGLRYWMSKGVLHMNTDSYGNPAGLVLCALTPPVTAESVLEMGVNVIDYQSLRTKAGKSRTDTEVQPEITDSDLDRLFEDRHRDVAFSTPSRQEQVAETEMEQIGRGKAQPSAAVLNNALNDPAFIELRDQAEGFFNRPLSNEDIDAIWRIYGDLKLPFEVCEYLLEYCGTSRDNHPERLLPAYYEKVARNWKEHGISSKEEARKFTQDYFFGSKLLRALGIRDRYIPTDAENRLLSRWREEYHFTDEMLILACERAVIRKGSASGFGYVDGILKSWHDKHISTPEDVERYDSLQHKDYKPKAVKNNEFMQGSLSADLDMIEKMAYKTN